MTKRPLPESISMLWAERKRDSAALLMLPKCWQAMHPCIVVPEDSAVERIAQRRLEAVSEFSLPDDIAITSMTVVANLLTIQVLALANA